MTTLPVAKLTLKRNKDNTGWEVLGNDIFVATIGKNNARHLLRIEVNGDTPHLLDDGTVMLEPSTL